MNLDPRLVAFLEALPQADPETFVSPPGLGGTWRVKFIREGMEKGVVVVHWTGMGLAIHQPKAHGICPECAAAKDSRTICNHCACDMCVWFRHTDELNSPRVSPERIRELAQRMKAFRFAQAPQRTTISLDEELA
jgi:hypothetical protein